MDAEILTSKWLVAAFLASMVGVHPLYWLLLILVVIDFATGLLVGYITRSLSAKICKAGIARKVVMLLLVGAATIMGKNIGHLTGGTVPDLPLGRVVAAFYAVNEMLSVAENAGLIGLPIPKAIRVAITKLRAINPPDDYSGEILTDAFKDHHGITGETKEAPVADSAAKEPTQ